MTPTGGVNKPLKFKNLVNSDDIDEANWLLEYLGRPRSAVRATAVGQAQKRFFRDQYRNLARGTSDDLKHLCSHPQEPD